MAPDGLIFGHISARLTQKPDWCDVDGLAQASAQEALGACHRAAGRNTGHGSLFGACGGRPHAGPDSGIAIGVRADTGRDYGGISHQTAAAGSEVHHGPVLRCRQDFRARTQAVGYFLSRMSKVYI